MEVTTQSMPLPLALVETNGKAILVVQKGLLDPGVVQELARLLATVETRCVHQEQQQTA